MKIRNLLNKIARLITQIIQLILSVIQRKEVSVLSVLYSFPLYTPNSMGSYEDRSKLTIQTINQVFPSLNSLAKSFNKKTLKITDIEALSQSADDVAALDDLKFLFNKYGSDKADHNYHNFYGTVLKNRDEITAVFEVGLGTNNTDIVSTMGKYGKPGASLRAFRDFLPKAKIFGADIDKRVLFSEDRIETFYVDQTKPESFIGLQNSIPDNSFDLIIDDGLHSPDANALTLNFGLSKIKVGGWVAVEDTSVNKIPFWEIVCALLPDQYESYMFKAHEGLIFAVKRVY